MRSDGQKGEMRSIHGGQKATEGKRNRGSLTAIAPVPCRRAFRTDINFYSLLLSGVAVTTLLYFAAEGPQAAGGGVEWSGRNNYVSGVQCPTAHPPHTVHSWC